jgi:hypothetical protein
VLLQLVASDLSGAVLDQVLDTCSNRILEVHGDTLTKLYPVTRPHELQPLVKVENLKKKRLQYKKDDRTFHFTKVFESLGKNMLSLLLLNFYFNTCIKICLKTSAEENTWS